ncbi:hypothetical protein ACJW30_05G073300 [Castanea mollissima]
MTRLPLLQPILCFSFNPLSQQPGTGPHKAKSLTTTGDACRYGVLLISLSLSLIWVSLFSPSLKPSRGRASASTHTYRRWWYLSSASQPLVTAVLRKIHQIEKYIRLLSKLVDFLHFILTEVREADIGEYSVEALPSLSHHQGGPWNDKSERSFKDVGIV